MRVAVFVCLLLALAGCSSGPSQLTFGPGRVTPIELQARNRAIADTFATKAGETWDRVISDASDRRIATIAAHEKVSTVSAAWAIAGGRCDPSAVVEMVVLFSLLRHVYERPWVVELLGAEQAAALVAQQRGFERRAWETAELALTPVQRAELAALIEEWVAAHPDQTSVALVRFGDLTGVRRAAERRDSPPGSLLSLFMLDPLNSLNPATRELEQTRQVAERLLYSADRWPILIRWHLELLGLRIAASNDFGTMVSAFERTSAAASDLPAAVGAEGQRLVDLAADRIAAEREAAIARVGAELERRSEATIARVGAELDRRSEALLVGLDERGEEFSELLREVRETAEAGDRLSVNLGAATVELQNLLRSGARSDEAAPPGATLADIRELVDSTNAGVERLAEVTVALREVIESPGWADRTADLSTVVADIDRRTAALVNRAAVMLGLLILLAAMAFGGAMIIARRIPRAV
ncbi:MAG: hypothetical protein ACTS3F_09195 [Phycisphaerales bacterium]